LHPFGDGKRIAVLKTLCPNERASNASPWHPGFVQAKDEDMRDFRDAKAMAQTLRASLAAKGHKITISQSLELIAEAFGAADWNTLSAAIHAEAVAPRNTASPPPPRTAENAPGTQFSSTRFSSELESTLQRALAYANQRKHKYSMLEHLLLALTEDVDALAVMKAGSVDLDKLRSSLVDYLETKIENLVAMAATMPNRPPAFSAPCSARYSMSRHRAATRSPVRTCSWPCSPSKRAPRYGCSPSRA
jgi:Glyoxalase superfamily protein/Clp amino terminal domain, pathogenicity island component